jgi:ribonuclease G
MERDILISMDEGHPRVAVLEDGQLVEVGIERPQTQRLVGSIYRGRVQNVLPGMQAAFVDVGLERNAFLFVDDAHPPHAEDLERDGSGAARTGREVSISDLIREGQEIIVQVAKEPSGTKGARVTRHVTLPGRYLVLMPTVDYVGVSRRIEDEAERERLRQIARRIRRPGTGLIVRTVAEGRSQDELEEDWRFLRRAWIGVRRAARRATAPALLYRDLGLVPRILRDQLDGTVRRIVVDDPEERQRIFEFLQQFSPADAVRVDLHAGNAAGLFAAEGVEQELEKALARRVWLRSGGYLVIDQMEALTAVDVNTGRFVGTTDLADTVFRTNLEAAAEIARQLRLRDIGGIIVVDFIDMDVPDHRRRVVEALQEACRPDHARPTVLGLTQLGLVEMTRKKARQSLRDLLTRPCPHCDGRGRIPSEEAAGHRVRRELREAVRGADGEAVLVEVHPSVAAQLIGAGGSNLRDLERQTGRVVFVRGSDACGPDDLHLLASGSRREVEAMARPVREGQIIDLRVEEPHASNAGDGIARVEGYVIDIEGAGRRVGESLRVEITRAFRTYAKARIV